MQMKQLIILFAATVLAQKASGDTQVIPLAQGSNLIAFQVQPTNAAPSAVFGPLGAGFAEVSTYDNLAKKWTVYRNPNQADSTASNGLPGLAMGPVSVGNGYIVRMTAPATLTVNGTTPTSPSVSVYPGLNLLGFPLPAAAPSPLGHQDVFSGPAFNLSRAFEMASPGYLAFTNDGLNNDKTFLFDKNKAYWVDNTSASSQIWTPQVSQPPLVYFAQGDTMVVEAPLAGSADATINVPVKLTRTFSGRIGFLVTGTAHPNTDFAVTAVTTPVSPTNSIGEITVNATANTYQIPVTIKAKARIQTNASVVMTLRRPAETTAVSDSGTLPQVACIKITDGMKGTYDGFLKGTSPTATLSGQNFRIALRSNGQAVFDPADGGMISSRFTLPYTLQNGAPQFTGSANVTLASTTSLQRSVSVSIVPSSTASLDVTASANPSFDLPLTLLFTNLTAAGPFQTTCKITLTQADPEL